MNTRLRSTKSTVLSTLFVFTNVLGCSQSVAPPAPPAPPALPVPPATGAVAPAMPPAANSVAPVPGPPTLPIPADPKLAAFQLALAPYIAEARALADEIEKVPSEARCAEITAQITQHHATLPPTPEGVDRPGHIRVNLKNIKDQFKVAEFQSKQQKDIDIKQPMTLFANDIRGFCNKIEKKLLEAAKPSE